jgi:5'-3' exoribonuclease 2
MVEVFKYTERVVNMARPRKVLMMAIGKPRSHCLGCQVNILTRAVFQTVLLLERK